MKFKDHLSETQKNKLDEMRKEEKVNWREMMGQFNKGMKRKPGGAMGNK